MSYTGFGVVGIVAAAKPTAAKAALLPAGLVGQAPRAAEAASCRSGPMQQTRPFGRAAPRYGEEIVHPLLAAARKRDDARGVNWGGERKMWVDRFLEYEVMSEVIGYQGRHFDTCGVVPGSGFPHPDSWPSAAFIRLDPQTYRFWQEHRIRLLLEELTSRPPGFKNKFEQLAYDASFCGPVTVSFRLDMAVRAAIKAFDKRFPQSRWKNILNVFSVTCDGRSQTWGGWRPVSPISDSCEKIVIDQPWATHIDDQKPTNRSVILQDTAHAQYGARWPLGEYRLHPMQVLSVYGGRIVPTKWFEDLLNCLAPGWQQYR